MVWGTCHKPEALNPIITTGSISASLFSLIFNQLVRINSRDDVEPDLAQSWDITDDGLVYTFHLRKGVKFHDGKECTSADVKFTYDMIVDPANNSVFRFYFKNVAEFNAVDAYTFSIKLLKPSVFFIQSLVRPILPKHLFESGLIRNSFFDRHPVGTGPFKFREWTDDNRIILEYNPAYYEGRPYLDSVVVKVYPDAEALWAGFMRRETDMDLFIGESNYEIVKDDPSFKSYASAVDNYYALMLDVDDPVLKDKVVRRAIAYAIDKKSLIRYVAKNYGLECPGPFSQRALGAHPDMAQYLYDPRKSQELLADAGWKDIDNDLILEKDGKKLELRILVDLRNDIYRKISQVLRQQLHEIGVKVSVYLYDNDAMLTRNFLKDITPQARIELLYAGTDILDHLVMEYWSAAYRNSADKLWGYDSDEVTGFFKLVEGAVEKHERQGIYREINRLICEDQPACFLYTPMVFHAVSKEFANTDDFFSSTMPVYTIKDWYQNKQSKGGEKKWR
ncbi:MAG: ABC transporter substrate-binding protein [Candidatus Omnitrophota bacterium]